MLNQQDLIMDQLGILLEGKRLWVCSC